MASESGCAPPAMSHIRRMPDLALIAPDAGQWAAFAGAHPDSHPLQSPAWGALKNAFGWSARVLAVAGPRGLLAGALLLTRRRAGLAAAYVPRGPLLSGDAQADALLLDQLERVARSQRAVFLRLEPGLLEDDERAGALHSALLLRDFQPADPLQPHSSVHLDLRPEPERLLAAMSKGHRADIRRAAREGVVATAGRAEHDLDAFYSILEETSRRNQFGIHSRAYYQATLEQFGDAAQLWVARREGLPEAAALTIAWGRQSLYLASGSSEAGLRSGAQHAIQWEVIRWARERGCATYDLWGIPDAFGQAAVEQDAGERERLEQAAKADALYGVYRFKKGFGGRVVRYLPAYDRVFLAPLYALWRRRIS
jgi:serine/alanine adding enzyme